MRKKYFNSVMLVLVLIFSISTKAQNKLQHNLADLLTINFYSEYKTHPKRKILNIKGRSNFQKANPLIYLSAGLLYVYQQIISEQIQAECRYEISCSNYTKIQLEINGFKGFLLGFNQLNNCFSGVIYDYERIQISNNSKVINSIEKIEK